MDNILLMSIKTKYEVKIFNGTKTYEFRRKSIGEKNLNKRVYIYSSEDKKEIVGYVIFDEILCGNALELVDKTGYEDVNGIVSYFNGIDGYALHIKEYYKFIKPIKIDEVKFVIPQFYRYISKDEELYKLVLSRKVIHNMNLQLEYFNYIKNGTKRVELRLNDEKRKRVWLYDYIIFNNNSNSEKLVCLVNNINKANSFEKLIGKNIGIYADNSVLREELLKKLNSFYSIEEQEKYGVIGIGVEPLYVLDTFVNDNVVDEIYELTKGIEKYYSDYKEWLYNKQCVNSDDRVTIYIRNFDKIIGVCNLKLSENKLCTIYIDGEYRNKGIGGMLLNEAFKYLGTSKPYLTCNKDNLKYLNSFIKKYKWKKSGLVGKEILFNKEDLCQ